MKKIILLSGIAFIALVLGGCLTTLHPIFTENDLVTDARLAGNWEKTKDKTKVSYRRPDADELNALSPEMQKNAAKIYMQDERDDQGNTLTTYYAFMVKLGKYYYMDYYPSSKREQTADDFYGSHYIAMHSIFRIQFGSNNSFTIQQLDAGYLEKLIRNKQIRIRHEVMEDGNFVITASTEELQQYLVKYSDVPEAYSQDNKETYIKIK